MEKGTYRIDNIGEEQFVPAYINTILKYNYFRYLKKPKEILVDEFYDKNLQG